MKTPLLLSTLVLSMFALAPSYPADPQCEASCQTTAAPTGKSIVETALAAGEFETLAAALKAANLVEALEGDGPFTVFAPTDAAFAKLPKGAIESLLEPKNRATLTNVLTYHVVPGRVMAADVVKRKNASALNGQRLDIKVKEKEGVRVAGALVTTTDIECRNGIIHVVDAVMMPSTKNVVETAAGLDQFSTLVAAVTAADLAEALQGDGPFTILAPTNEAFAALPEGTVESLLQPENKDALVSILKYHVVSGRVYSDQLESGEVATLQGGALALHVGEDGVRFNDSRVVAADVETTNGVIHVIDRVLLPRP